MFNRRTEKLRGLVVSVTRIPVAYVLATIQSESGGIIGKTGKVALGLMQVLKSTLRSFNEKTGGSFTVSNMTGKTERDARAQIQVGSWYLKRCLVAVHNVDPALFPWPVGPMSDQQAQYASLCYLQGIGGFLSYRRRALRAGYTDNLEGMERYHNMVETDFGKPYNRPFRYVHKVFNLYKKDRGGVPSEALVPSDGSDGGIVLMAMATGLLFAYWLKKRSS